MEPSEEFPSQDDIDVLDELFIATDVCEQHCVPYSGLETLDEIKERLVLEYKRRTQESPKTEIEVAMQRASEEDERKRGRLIEMFEELVDIIGTKDESRRIELVKDLLQKDQTSGDILGDCDSKVDELKENECVILVAGESSAGKSSFLNLLLGSQFLPTHTCNCTSSITTLRYGTKKRARIIYGGPDPRVDVIENLDRAGMKELYNITFMKGKEREEGHNVKEVQVFLPIDFLKCGIVLADTPGIGENEFLETYLMQFISENQILGFIYLIFSDSAGGVQEDRLLLLLKLIMDQQKKNRKSLKFDPKAALFLANRFDAVPIESRDKVKAHILCKLGKYWPEFDESMAVFFSTQNARRDVDAHPDYINGDYEILLEGISKLLSTAMERRIRTSYKWIETVLKRINHYLKTTVARLGWTQRDTREKSLKQRTKLQKLKERSNTVIRELTINIDNRSEEIVTEIQQYLITPQAKFLLCSVWRDNEIPEISVEIRDRHHWQWVKRRVDEAFYDRLCNAIEDWDDDKCKVSTIETEIVDNIKSKLGVLQEEISQVEKDLQSTQGSTGSNESVKRSRRRSSLQMSGALIVDVPLKLAPTMQHRVSTNPISRLLVRNETVKYKRDPQTWARERAQKLMAKLLQNKRSSSEYGSLTQLVDQLMQRPRDIVDRLKLQIPHIIDTNLQLLNSLEDLLITEVRFSAKYEQMMVQVEGLKKSLMYYGEGYIFVNDFKSNELKVLQNTPDSQSLTQSFRINEFMTGSSTLKHQWVTMFPQGLWTKVLPGTLHREGTEIPVSIKLYMQSSGVSHTFQEVAKLRCLLHNDVCLAEFLGIHHTDAVTPAYIFDGRLQTLEQFVADSTNIGSQLPRLLSGIAEGLFYLHSKGMVHMELKTSTVTVTDNGDVSMTGACVPRQATLPLEKETAVSDFVYLAPEILKNDLYITSADVYGFGLLVYELEAKRKAFDVHRTFSFNDFVDALNPHTMLHLDTEAQAWFSESTLNLIKQCVIISETERPNMNVVKEMVESINWCEIKENKQARRTSFQMPSPGEVFRRSAEYEKITH